MNLNNHSILTKVAGVIEALGQLPARELQHEPSIQFAEDYNKLRSLFLQLNPDHEQLVPPEVVIYRGNVVESASGRYIEILSYCKQLQGFLRPLVLKSVS